MVHCHRRHHLVEVLWSFRPRLRGSHPRIRPEFPVVAEREFLLDLGDLTNATRADPSVKYASWPGSHRSPGNSQRQPFPLPIRARISRSKSGRGHWPPPSPTHDPFVDPDGALDVPAWNHLGPVIAARRSVDLPRLASFQRRLPQHREIESVRNILDVLAAFLVPRSSSSSRFARSASVRCEASATARSSFACSLFA